MDCPHCAKGFHPQFQEILCTLDHFELFLYQQTCPGCGKPIVQVFARNNGTIRSAAIPRITIYPPTASLPETRPVPSNVPEPYSQDFLEAVQTLTISPKASAALSRRIIQALLRDKAGTKSKDLRDQIDEVLKAQILPSYIADDLHAARNIGNLGAHEIKDRVSGEILDVEPGQAEWTLDVAEAMLDFYFVEPAKATMRRSELNEKLRAAGKPEVSEAATSPTKVR